MTGGIIPYTRYMGNVSVLVKAAISACLLLTGVSACTPPPAVDQSAPLTPVSTPEPSPNPMATLNGLSVYVNSTGVQILDQSLVTASRGYDVTVPDGVTQIGFAAMCETAAQDWSVTVDDNELDWTSPAECPTKAIYSTIVDVVDTNVVTVQVGLDPDTFLALVAYVAAP